MVLLMDQYGNAVGAWWTEFAADRNAWRWVWRDPIQVGGIGDNCKKGLKERWRATAALGVLSDVCLVTDFDTYDTHL